MWNELLVRNYPYPFSDVFGENNEKDSRNKVGKMRSLALFVPRGRTLQSSQISQSCSLRLQRYTKFLI